MTFYYTITILLIFYLHGKLYNVIIFQGFRKNSKIVPQAPINRRLARSTRQHVESLALALASSSSIRRWYSSSDTSNGSLSQQSKNCMSQNLFMRYMATAIHEKHIAIATGRQDSHLSYVEVVVVVIVVVIVAVAVVVIVVVAVTATHDIRNIILTCPALCPG